MFVVTAVAELLGCYLPMVWLRRGGSVWWLVLAAASLTIFVWLLTLHPSGVGRTYAAYGGVYVASAVVWGWLIDGQRPDRWDVVGAGIAITGMLVIAFAPRS